MPDLEKDVERALAALESALSGRPFGDERQGRCPIAARAEGETEKCSSTVLAALVKAQSGDAGQLKRLLPIYQAAQEAEAIMAPVRRSEALTHLWAMIDRPYGSADAGWRVRALGLYLEHTRPPKQVVNVQVAIVCVLQQSPLVSQVHESLKVLVPESTRSQRLQMVKELGFAMRRDWGTKGGPLRVYSSDQLDDLRSKKRPKSGGKVGEKLPKSGGLKESSHAAADDEYTD